MASESTTRTEVAQDHLRSVVPKSNPQTNKQRLNSIIGNAILVLIIIGLLIIDDFLNVSDGSVSIPEDTCSTPNG
jgi:hypothetical protein